MGAEPPEPVEAEHADLTEADLTEAGLTEAGLLEAGVIEPDPIEPEEFPDPPPAIVAEPAAAAFFDLDNTLVQGASMFHLAKGLYRRDYFPLGVIMKGVWLQAYFRVVGRENPDHIANAQAASLSFIAGHRAAEIERLSAEIYDESIAHHIWPGTRAIAQMHLDAGHQVWLVTAAPVEVAGVIAGRLGMTGALGSVAEREDGLYTGRLTGLLLHGPAKADAVRKLATVHEYRLERCYAYSDSANDLPMLTAVGQPCAINPDRRLAGHAARSGWPIRDFRGYRRAVRYGLVGAGVLAAGMAVRRRRRG